jgi:hypothetical protein
MPVWYAISWFMVYNVNRLKLHAIQRVSGFAGLEVLSCSDISVTMACPRARAVPIRLPGFGWRLSL